MDKDILTIKDFAEKAGVSVQSIYKKIRKENNPIQRYLTEFNGVKYIRAEALEILYNGADEEIEPALSFNEQQEENDTAEQQENHTAKNTTDRILTILEQQLEEQRRQLQEKDKLIAEQNLQINSLLARLEDSSRLLGQSSQLLDQQQKLTAAQYKELAAGHDDTEIKIDDNKKFHRFWNKLRGK